MVKPTRWMCKLMFWSLVLWLLQSSRSVWAGPCWEDHCGGACTCIPNAQDFGYFRTVWRQWPCEPRPRQTFPQSMGIETLPAPEGQEQLPTSEVTAPGGQEGEGLPTGVPGQLPAEPPLEDRILPAEEPFQIETPIPGLPSEPAEPPVTDTLLPGILPEIEEEKPAERAERPYETVRPWHEPRRPEWLAKQVRAAGIESALVEPTPPGLWLLFEKEDSRTGKTR